MGVPSNRGEKKVLKNTCGKATECLRWWEVVGEPWRMMQNKEGLQREGSGSSRGDNQSCGCRQ